MKVEIPMDCENAIKETALAPLYAWMRERPNIIYLCGLLYGEAHNLTEEQYKEFTELYHKCSSKPLVDAVKRVGLAGMPLPTILKHRSYFTNPDTYPCVSEKNYTLRAVKMLSEDDDLTAEDIAAYKLLLQRIEAVPDVEDRETWSVTFRYES